LQDGLFDHERLQKVLPTARGAYRTPVPLEPGLVGSASLTVGEEDTAAVLGSGDVPVLATPSVVLLSERATVAAVHPHVREGETTVGYRVQLDHLAPVPVGDDVQAEAVLESVEGRRLTFRVSVKHRDGLVAAGRITRVVVERSRFLGKAAGSV
jgi:predicted thioesterase